MLTSLGRAKYIGLNETPCACEKHRGMDKVGLTLHCSFEQHAKKHIIQRAAANTYFCSVQVSCPSVFTLKIKGFELGADCGKQLIFMGVLLVAVVE